MHAPKSHPIKVTKDLIECMITGFNQKHFQKQLPNITAEKELNRSVSRSWPTNKPTKTVKHHKATTFRPRICKSYFTKLQEHWYQMKPHKACNFRFTKSKGRGEKLKKRYAESTRRGEMQRAKGWGQLNATLGLGLENIIFILAFFLSVGLVEPVRFGSIGFRLWKPNREFFVIF